MVLGLPRRPKGEANRAALITSRGLRFPLWKPLGDSAEAVQTAEKLQNTRSSRTSPRAGVAIPSNRGKNCCCYRTMFEKRRGLLRRYAHWQTLPRALLSCADKKVGKEAAEDLPYGPRTPQTVKRGSEPGCVDYFTWSSLPPLETPWR